MDTPIVRKIEPRDGAEVYVGANGHVCIRQLQCGIDEKILIFHRDEVPELIELLKATYQDSLDFVPDSEISGATR